MPSKKAKSALVVAAAGMALVVGGGTASANPNAAYIGYGHVTSGTPVWCVQQMLNYIASNSHPGPPAPGTIAQDNSFGPDTYAMVEWLQTANNAQPNASRLDVDGVVGPATGTVILSWASRDYYQDYCKAYVPSYS
ncbi:peptidoglycan-binding domain-containing protein [Kitasatospora sp. NPDC048545]|uniref:peptidoglycan-binding domain-containing protein n=1 Tax=Kitasatospora sp. NPDC048545 TaxID=3157208 RepID=UPI0033F6D7F2